MTRTSTSVVPVPTMRLPFRRSVNPTDTVAIAGEGDEVLCPLCGAAGLPEVCEARDPRYALPALFRIFWCSRCEIASTHPRLSTDDRRAYYPDEYEPYQEEPSGLTHSRVHRLLLAAEQRFGPAATDSVSPGSLLDVGCGNGRYMAAMAVRGFSVQGVEMSRKAAEVVTRLGFPVVVGEFLQVSLGQDSFDVVTMNHFLEHSSDPRKNLERAHALLKRRGRLVVGVPNFASWARRHFGSNWSDLEVPRHAFHFTPRGLVRLLNESGFHVDVVRFVPAADAGSLVTSILVRYGKRNDPLVRRLYPVLHAACYPVGLPLSLLQCSAWIRVFATKFEGARYGSPAAETRSPSRG